MRALITARRASGVTRFVATMLGLAALMLPAQAREIWFAPPDNLPREAKTVAEDFPSLFAEPPSWNTKIDVFQVTPYYATRAGDEDLKRVAAFLAKRGIALAVAVQSTQITDECGMGEGRVRPKVNGAIFRRLHRLGLDIKYISLDEPLTFAHYQTRIPNPCRFPIVEVARRVAASIREIREYYPDAKIIDYEYPSLVPPAQFLADLPVWLRAFREQAGVPIDGFVFDLNWRETWIDWVRPAAALLKRERVRTGIFLTIAGPGTSDPTAIASLKDNIAAVEAARLDLDIEIIARWTRFPSRLTPSSDPLTLTAVLDWHLARRGRNR
jgi:hypothetical protein